MLRSAKLQFVLVLLIVALAACAPAQTGSSTGSTALPTPAPTAAPTSTSLAATPNTRQSSELQPIKVAGVEVQIGVGSPIPVDAFISAELPDICAQLAEVKSSLNGFKFEIMMLVTPGSREECFRDTLPFRMYVPLNMVNLPDGMYTVVVNGVSTTFNWPSAPAGTPAAATSNTPQSSELQPLKVASVEVQIGVGSPIPVDAFISAELPDTCAQLGEVKQKLSGSKFEITMSAIPGTREECMRDTLPFRMIVPLNMVSLPKGMYTVAVNGVSTTFNWPSMPTTAAPQASASRYQGFVVYEAASGKFTAYDLQGKPSGFTVDAGPLFVGRSPDETQVVNDVIYYRGEDKKIIRTDAQGSRKLENIPAENLSTYKVSPDEQLIAWTSNLWEATPPRSELWIAKLDGSQARQVMTSTAAANGEFLTLAPYRWTDDGQLLIVEAPTNTGFGYNLYRAYHSLHRYDPQAGETKLLYQPDNKANMCLSDITPDLARVGLSCSDAGAGKVSLHQLADGKTTAAPDLPEQGQAGSIRFSPSSAWIAYSIARGDPEEERGQVAVVPVDLSSAPKIIASQDGGYYDVVDWIDEDTLLLFLTGDGQGSIWRVKRDGSDLTQLATGSYVAGLMANK